jgi:hypothetical protein
MIFWTPPKNRFLGPKNRFSDPPPKIDFFDQKIDFSPPRRNSASNAPFCAFFRSLFAIEFIDKIDDFIDRFFDRKNRFFWPKKSIFLIFLAQPKKCGKKKNFQFLKIPEKFSQNF